MKEQYIYLGFKNNTFFYIHVVADSRFDPTISGDIYNVMINECQIIDPDINVVIYEMSPDSNFNIIIIQHESKEKQLEFEISNLSIFFRRLIMAPRNEMYTICYDYDKKCFETDEIKGDLVKPLLNLMPESDIMINGIEYIISRKEIP